MPAQKLKERYYSFIACFQCHNAFGHLNSLTQCTEKIISAVLPEGRLILGLKHCGIKLKTHMHEKLSRLNQFKTNPQNRSQGVFSSL